VPGALRAVGAGSLEMQWLLASKKADMAIDNSVIPNTFVHGWTVGGDTLFINTPQNVDNPYPNYQFNSWIFKGLPAQNSSFGNHDVNLYVQNTKTQTTKIQTFFSTTAKNWPSSDGITPNWYHYYNMVSTASGGYGSGKASSTTNDTDSFGVRTAVTTIRDDAYPTGGFRVFGLNSNVSPYVICLGTIYDGGTHNFIEISAHERGHQNAWLTPGIETLENAPDKNGASTSTVNLALPWKNTHHFQTIDSRGGAVYDTTGAYSNIPSAGLAPDPGDIECVADIQALQPLLSGLPHWQDDWADGGLQIGKPYFYQNGTPQFFWKFYSNTSTVTQITPSGSADPAGYYRITSLADLQAMYPGTTVLTSLSQLGP
jgi:hypothetical protein